MPMAIAKVDINATSSKIVKLSEDASSVIVGNPSHVSVSMDNPRMMVMTALMPGVTQVIVLGAEGKVIWSDSVSVNRPTEQIIRVRNACINSDDASCQAVRLFNCEDGAACENVNLIGSSPVATRRR